MAYSINQAALITGLTTRTLRNHLKQGILKGEKIDGNWSFTEEELDAYMGDPGVRQAISAKQHAVIYDFLAEPYKRANRVCTILDLPVPVEEAVEIAQSSAGRSWITGTTSNSATSTSAITPVSSSPARRIRCTT